MISFIRNYTGILAEEALSGIIKRFEEYCGNLSIECTEESFKIFWKPVGYLDFLSIMQGKTIVYDGQEHTLQRPYFLDFDGKVDPMFGPSHASAQGEPRFGGWSSPTEVPFPVDADLRIRISLSDKESWKNVLLSYNEISGLCSSGRDIHWSEPWTYKSLSPGNSFLADHGNNFLSDPLYRSTPKGEAKVSDLIKKGTVVKSNYCDTEYIVSDIRRFTYQPKERPEDHIFETYSLSLIDRESGKGGYFINELVAAGGRILKLFMANEDEVYVLGNAGHVPSPIVEEDEEEVCESCLVENTSVCSTSKKEKSEPLHIKGVQLTLF